MYLVTCHFLKENNRTGPSAGLCSEDLSPLYLLHRSTCLEYVAGKMLKMLEKRIPNILTVVESGSSVADRHVKHFVVCTPHAWINLDCWPCYMYIELSYRTQYCVGRFDQCSVTKYVVTQFCLNILF